MRTTVEIKDAHRARLLELAARRGEKGFSRIIEEAIEAYLKTVKENEEMRRRALLLRGSLSLKEAARLRQEAAALRRSWR